LRVELARKEEEERRVIEEKKLRLLAEMEEKERFLLADEARLREIREIDALRREIDARADGAHFGPSVRKQVERKRGRGAPPPTAEFDDFVIREYSNLRESGQPDLPFFKIKDGVYRFGTRNITLCPSGDGQNIVVRQGSNFVSFADFVAKYRKVEFTKMRGLQSLNGFVGAGYV